MYPLKMQPAIKDYLWGGTRLIERYGKKTDLPVAAESWEISCHPDGKSIVLNGELAGAALAYALERNPSWMGTLCDGFNEFPLLIKFIHAKQPLSLQVHPDDNYARKVENQSGKNEMWYIVEAEPGAELILGFKEEVNAEELRQALLSDKALSLVNRIPVRQGDCYCIPAGMVHAIGGGILIAEIQQNSNVTYRVYDYGRKDKDGNSRELHIDKALDVIDSSLHAKKSTGESLADWPYFKCRLVTIDGSVNESCDSFSFQCLISLNDRFTLSWKEEKLQINKGDTVFIPAGLGAYAMEGAAKVLLVSM